MLRSIVAGLIFLGAALPAAAGEVVYRFSGVVEADGRDQNGIFGTADGSLAGLDFTAVYRWDPAVVPAALTRDAHAQSVVGGGNFGTAQAINGTLTINGQSFVFGTELGSLLRENGVGSPSSGGGFDQIGAQAFGNEPFLGISFLQTIVSSNIEFISNADLTSPLASTPAPLSRPLSSFSIQRPGSGNFSLFTEGSFSINSFSVDVTGPITVAEPPAGAVPEPATWAMLLIGFGVAGAALRRRRVAASVAG